MVSYKHLDRNDRNEVLSFGNLPIHVRGKNSTFSVDSNAIQGSRLQLHTCPGFNGRSGSIPNSILHRKTTATELGVFDADHVSRGLREVCIVKKK
jgi:hypothetical protein